MTSEQLQATRAIRWRQNAAPILTLEDAQTFLQQTGLCLFLPRKAQLPAPAPSFVEACLGETNATPPRAAIEAALDLLSRLIDGNLAIPLNLFGTQAGHPDFVVSPDTLPFVFALRGDRDWKHAPGSGANRVSPLVLQVWKAIEKKGVLSADEIKDAIGRELTEAAALRALYELWGSMRVTPLYQTGGEPTLWEALQTRQQKALNAGTNMSQVTALSVLVSLYLESAVAATSEEVEIFLSSLTSRSKVREAVRGLTATRQLAMISMERETLLHVEGSLPEFDESIAIAAASDGEQVPEPRLPQRPIAAERRASASRPRTRPASAPGGSLSISKKMKLPDTISVWPRPVPDESAPTEDRPAEDSGADQTSSFAASAAPSVPPATRREKPMSQKRGLGHPHQRTPARPPWKDKGKPGFAKSQAGKGDKARWPREPRPDTRSAADKARPAFRPSPASGPRPAFKPRADSRRADSPRQDFKPRPSTGRPAFGRGKSESRPGGGFKPRSDSKSAGSYPPRRAPSSAGASGPRAFSPFKPRGDFKDFKARKPGDFKRSSGTASGARTGFKPAGSFKPGGTRPPFAGPSTGGRPQPGGEFRRPWKDRPEGKGGSRPEGPAAFRPRKARTDGPRPASDRTAGRPPSRQKTGGFARPDSGSGAAQRSSPRTDGPRTFSKSPGGFKPGFKKTGFNKAGSTFRTGDRPTGASSAGDSSRSKPGFAKKPGFSPRPGGFAKGPGAGSRFSKSSGPRGASRPPGNRSSRPPGPPRPKRKPE